MLFCLAGCATAPEQPAQIENEADLQGELAATPVRTQAVIDEEVLYLLMTAELAGQRNQYYLAMDAYLQAAKRVGDPRIAERAVKIGLFLKDEQRTKEALEIWLAKDGKNLGARKFAVLLAIKEADRKSAIENLGIMLQEDPAGFESSMLEMVKLLEKEGRVQFTYDVLESVNYQHPNNPGLLFVQALLASMLSDTELAQGKIDKVLSIQSDWHKALIFQAQLAGRSGDLPKARKYLEKAVKQTPEDVQLRKMLIEVLVNSGAYDDAIRVCQNALEDKPDDGDALLSLAMIHIQQNQYDKAENALEKLFKNPDWQSQAALYLGKIEVERKHPDKALVWFDKVGEGNYAFEADISSVSILMNQKRFEEVEARLNGMTEQYPKEKLRIAMLKAEMLNQAGRYQDAFDILSGLLADAQENRDILYARALLAERIGRMDIAEIDLRKILQSKPEDVDALNALGYTLADKTTRYDEAEKYLLQAMRLQPDAGVIIDSYGWLQFKKGRQEVALEYLRKAYANAPENEIAAHIAEVLWSMGNQKEAKDFFEGIFKKAPEDEYLLQFKKRFLTGDQK